MDLKKGNILFFTAETYPTFAGDGRNALLFASILRSVGYNTSLLCLNPNGLLKSEEVVKGVKIYRVNYFYKLSLYRVVTRLLMVFQILRISKNFKYWIIYGGMPCHRLTIVLGRFLRKVVVFRSTLWGFDDIISLCDSKFYLKKYFLKCLYDNTSAYFALNDLFRTTWIDCLNYLKPIFISTQGVDCSLYSNSRDTKCEVRNFLGLSEDDFVVLLQGHLINRKGFTEIFKWLSVIDFNIKVIHVGRNNAPNWDIVSTKNSEMTDVMNYGKSVLGENLIFIGETNNVAQYMGVADVFILNSKNEGFPPNSLSEAMASGLPSLVRRMEGINSNLIIDGETVMLYSEYDEFKAKLALLRNNRSNCKQIGANAKEMMQKYNDINIVAKKFIHFIETKLA